MNAETPLSERPWRCPRCKCSRCYVTLEVGLSSNIQYEVMICDNCAHVEHRAADLDVVAALAAGGLRGVRHVRFPPEAQPSSWDSDPDPPLYELEAESAPRPENAAAVNPDPEIMPHTLRDVASPLPISVSESLDRTAALLQTKLDSPSTTEPVGGSGRLLTFLLTAAGLGAAAWLLFRQPETPEVGGPAPGMTALAASSVPFSDLPGAPHAVDPGALLEQARQVASLGSMAVLTQIEGIFVDPSGKVDFDNAHYKGRIVYHFEGWTDAPEPLPRSEGVPLGVSGSSGALLPKHFQRAVSVDAAGMKRIENNQWPQKQPKNLPQDVPPRCSFRQIWDAARTGDAPADAVATVKYSVKSDTPSWWFQIENTSFGFSFNPATCTRY